MSVRYLSCGDTAFTVEFGNEISPGINGRVMALELLVNTPAVSATIRDGKTFMLPGVMQTGKKQGMQLMDDALADLVRRGIVDPEEAIARAEQKGAMRKMFG